MNLGAEKQLFLDLVDLDPEARAAALAAIGDPDRRERVRALLDAHERATADDALEPLVERGGGIDRTGETIGRFRLRRQIASGGMGIVYEAEQDSPRRAVAVKVLQGGAGRETLRRFEHEAEILGQLQHPGIARVYEAGVAMTSTGPCPYLALELIDGEPIDRYVADRDVGADARIDLLAKVGDAVAHAHVRGVIHRDLKPQNILVEPAGQPKVLDFGIARLQTEGESLKTRAGQVLGTLPYMSPEQVAGDPAAIDTRTDVYALGVLAFQILGGRLPVDVEGKTLIEAAAAIREVEPPLLGTLDPELRGDLETIVAKALRKQPAERYAGAAELAADLRRFRQHEPIVARPATTMYQLRKLVRRHRPWFAGAAAVLVALIAGLIVATIERDRARAAESRATRAQRAAEEEAERARSRAEAMAAVTEIVQGVLRRASPTVSGSSEVDLARAVRESSDDIAAGLEGRPEVAAPIQATIGTLWLNLADHDRAEHHLRLALEAFASSELDDPVNEARALQSLGGVAAARSDFDTACAHLERATELAEALDGDHRGTLAGILIDRATAEHGRGRDGEALRLAERAIEIGAAVDGRDSTHHARRLDRLATILGDLRRWREARELLEEAVDIHERARSELPEAAEAMRDLGWARWRTGDQSGAVRMLERAAGKMRGIFADPHPSPARCLKLLADIYERTGQRDRAEPLYAEALAVYEGVFDAPNAEVEVCRRDLGLVRCALGDASGIELVRRSLETCEAMFGDGDANVMAAMQAMVEAYRRVERPGDAARYGAEVIARLEKAHGPEHARLVVPLVRQSYAHRDLGQHAAAETAMRRVVEIQRRVLGPEHATTLMYQCMLGRAMSDAGRHGDALGEIAGAVAKLTELLPADHAQLGQMQDLLEAVYRKAGRDADADALRRQRKASAGSGQ